MAVIKGLTPGHVVPAGTLIWLLLAYLAMSVAQICMGNYSIVLSATITETFAKSLRDRLYSHSLLISYQDFRKWEAGEWLTRFRKDIEDVASFFSNFWARIFTDAAIIAATLATMIYLNAALALAALIPVIIHIFIYMKNNSLIREKAREYRKIFGALTSCLQDAISGNKIVRQLGSEDRSVKRMEGHFGTMRRMALDLISTGGKIGMKVQFSSLLGPAAVLSVGSFLTRGGAMSLDTLVGFLQFIRQLQDPVIRFAGLNMQVQTLRVSLEKLLEVLELPEAHEAQRNGAQPVEAVQGIDVVNLSFSYVPGRQVLRSVNMTVGDTPFSAAGRTVAVVGESGSGKSTLEDILASVIPLREGKVFIFDGERLRDLHGVDRKSYLDKLGVVDQSGFLFRASIIDNIALGLSHSDWEVFFAMEPAEKVARFKAFLEDGDESDEMLPIFRRIFDAARLVSIHEEIKHRYFSLAGEQGRALSGGQRQRIALARALVRDPQVLILDEYDASLDPRARRALRETLCYMRQRGKLIIVVTHNFFDMDFFDRIYLLERGEVVESGTHSDLLRAGGKYSLLFSQAASGRR
jgi:ABC-type multidrug transport system fused ATPase/permease subunit